MVVGVCFILFPSLQHGLMGEITVLKLVSFMLQMFA